MKRFGEGWLQYGRRSLYGPDGVIRTQPMEGERYQTREMHYKKSERLAQRQKAEIDKCLSCTRPECSGGEGCFRDIRRKG